MKTSSWFTPLPPGYAGIGISRSVPAEFRHLPTYRALAPGAWFRSCASPVQYADRYTEILAKLDPKRVVLDLQRLAEERRACLALLGALTTKPELVPPSPGVGLAFRFAQPHRPRARPRGPRPRLVTPQTAPHPGPSEPAPGPFALRPPKPLTDRLAPVLALTTG